MGGPLLQHGQDVALKRREIDDERAGNRDHISLHISVRDGEPCCGVP